MDGLVVVIKYHHWLRQTWHNLDHAMGGYTWAFFLIVIAGLWLLSSPTPFAKSPSISAKFETPHTPRLVVLSINDEMITPATADYITRGIDYSMKQEADAMVVQLDTPGGLLSATHTIVKAFLNAPLPIVVYVYPNGSRAGSAGVFITLSANIAAMSPSSHLGAAHPVDQNGQWPSEGVKSKSLSSKKPDDASPQNGNTIMSQKIMNDMLAEMAAISKTRKRNPEWALLSIKQSATLTASEALKLNVIDLVATDQRDLYRQLSGQSIQVGQKMVQLNWNQDPPVTLQFEYSFRDRLLNLLTQPFVAYLLLTLGFYGLLFEITHPGFGIPGISGIICLLLGLFGIQTLSVNWAGAGLLILGLGFFIIEAFTPAFGLLFTAGFISTLLGTVLIYQTGDPVLTQALPGMIVSALILGSFIGFLLWKITKAQQQPHKNPIDKLIGMQGKVVEPIVAGSKGKVYVNGETWDAQSDSTISLHTPVVIHAIDTNATRLLTVTPLNKDRLND